MATLLGIVTAEPTFYVSKCCSLQIGNDSLEHTEAVGVLKQFQETRDVGGIKTELLPRPTEVVENRLMEYRRHGCCYFLAEKVAMALKLLLPRRQVHAEYVRSSRFRANDGADEGCSAHIYRIMQSRTGALVRYCFPNSKSEIPSTAENCQANLKVVF